MGPGLTKVSEEKRSLQYGRHGTGVCTGVTVPVCVARNILGTAPFLGESGLLENVNEPQRHPLLSRVAGTARTEVSRKHR